jgi:linoleoyl-CoA desaturase
MGLGMSGLGMVTMHDANHGSFSKNQKENRFFGNSLYLLGGSPSNWRYQHNTLHHGFTNIEGHDEDIAPPGVFKIFASPSLKNDASLSAYLCLVLLLPDDHFVDYCKRF